MIRTILLTIILLIANTAQANEPPKGTLAGTVTDKSNSETLIGVPVMLEGTTLGAVTDLDGNFLIENIPAGTYNVVFRYIGYNSHTLPAVVIDAGRQVTLNVTLESASKTLNEVTVTASMKRESIGSVLLMQRKSVTVQDGISSESIKKTPDKNSGDVVKRISGASVQEGRFVIVRGLNERYNTAMLNGIPLASTEPDRKAFSFDLFPASLLDNLLIVKTATPELPGDFAGGILQLNTKDIPDVSFLSFSAGTGLHSQSTFKPYKTYDGGSSDWRGEDDGTRSLPADFPGSEEFRKMNSQAKIIESKKIANDWAIRDKESSPLSQSYMLSFGRTGKILKKDFGMTGAINYNLSRKTLSVERADYDFDGSRNYAFIDEQSRENVFWGALLNASYKTGTNSVISFRNLYSVNAEDQVIMRDGTDMETNQEIHASAVKYTSTRFLNSMISGKHEFTKGRNLNWHLGFTATGQSTPNLRRMYYYRNLEEGTEDTTFFAYVPFGNASPNYAGKFFSELSENIYNGALNYTFPLSFIGENHFLKAGVSTQFKKREFDARVLGYVIVNPGQFNWTLLHRPLDSIFEPANMGTKGFRLDEITNPSDAYTAGSENHAAYLQFDNVLTKKIRLVWGLRVEKFIQTLNSFGYSNDTIAVNTDYTDVLPSLNLTYALNEKSNVRFAVSRTVARPEFRELAPFAFYDFSTATSVVGNDSLLRTNITNLDLRIEKYPEAGQVMSASVFYKDFRNPIEPVVESSGAGSRRISFANASHAYVAGVEIEVRKSLDFAGKLIDWKQWSNFSVHGNLALMKSVVDKEDDLRAEDDRPLQGQSPYVINAGLMYTESKSGFGCNVVYNRIGRRIYQVGNSSYLSIEEAPRNLIDLQISKRIFERGEVRFNVNDLLNEPGLFYQDQNSNGKYAADVDSGISTYQYGTSYSLSVSYRF